MSSLYNGACLYPDPKSLLSNTPRYPCDCSFLSLPTFALSPRVKMGQSTPAGSPHPRGAGLALAASPCVVLQSTASQTTARLYSDQSQERIAQRDHHRAVRTDQPGLSKLRQRTAGFKRQMNGACAARRNLTSTSSPAICTLT